MDWAALTRTHQSSLRREDEGLCEGNSLVFVITDVSMIEGFMQPLFRQLHHLESLIALSEMIFRKSVPELKPRSLVPSVLPTGPYLLPCHIWT